MLFFVVFLLPFFRVFSRFPLHFPGPCGIIRMWAESVLYAAQELAETNISVLTSGAKEDMIMKKIGLIAAGFLLGTAGVKLLSGKDAKKVYTHVTAAVLRAKDCVMETVTRVRENADDILTDARGINEARAAAEDAAVIEDAPAGADAEPDAGVASEQ